MNRNASSHSSGAQTAEIRVSAELRVAARGRDAGSGAGEGETMLLARAASGVQQPPRLVAAFFLCLLLHIPFPSVSFKHLLDLGPHPEGSYFGVLKQMAPIRIHFQLKLTFIGSRD